MKTNITISLLVTASFLFAETMASAQTCGTSQVTYSTISSQNFLPKWNATAGCISNSSIFDNGNVGVGNSSPIYPLEVSPVVTAGNLSSGGTWDVGLSVGANGSIGQQSTNKHAVFGTIYANKDILFANYDGTTFNERMRIVSGGNIGIGTTAPGAKLHVANNASSLRLEGSDHTFMEFFPDGPTTRKAWFGFGAASDNNITLLNEISGAHIIFSPTSGNVGIGTTTPTQKLYLNGHMALSGNPASIRYIFVDETSVGTTQFIMQAGAGSSGYGGAMNLYGHSHATKPGWVTAGISNVAGSGATEGRFTVNNQATAGGTDVFTVLRTGNVGIGTTAPTALLDVNGGACKSSGGSTWATCSDIRVKKDTSAFTDGLSVIKKIHPVRFRYNGKAGIKDTNTLNIGVIAQQIQPIAPYTVDTFMAKLDSTDTQETQLLDYNASPLFYLFINAFKELDSINVQKDSVINKLNQKLINSDSINTALNNTQQQSMDSLRTKTITQDNIITSLQNQLNQLASLIDGCCNSNGQGNGNNNNLMQSGTNNYKSIPTTTLTEVELSNKNSIVLNQNVPNPFAEQTTISYYLPNNVQRAQILFFEQSGKIIKTVNLTEKGMGVLNVFANDLSNGTYTYSLIIDGQTIETKKMIKQ